jgi:dethiobiotin synthetase
VIHGLFITGTDTGVGKTVVSAAMVCLYRPRGAVCYWKPIQTGIEQDDDTGEVRRLANCAGDEIHDAGVRLPHPVSPHLAAQRAGQRISVDALLTEGAGPTDVGAAFPPSPGFGGPAVALGAEAGRRPDTFWIVEGAGGVLVPINDDEAMVDLMTRLGLPVLVVARTALGTINHTLLTLEALRRRSVAIAGVVMVGAPDRDAVEAIARHGQTAVAAMPAFRALTADAVAGWAAEVRPSWTFS